MANFSDSFIANRNAVYGGGKPNNNTPSSGSGLSPSGKQLSSSFLENRQAIYSQPVVKQPVSKVITPTPQQKSVSQPQNNSFLTGIGNFLNSAVKGTEDFFSHLTTPNNTPVFQLKDLPKDLNITFKNQSPTPTSTPSAQLRSKNTPQVQQTVVDKNTQETYTLPDGTRLPAKTYLTQGKAPSIWDKIVGFFGELTGNGELDKKARAANAYAVQKVDGEKLYQKRVADIAKQQKITTQQADQALQAEAKQKGVSKLDLVGLGLVDLAKQGGNPFRNSPMEEVTKELGVRTMPTNKEFTDLLMTAALGFGLAEVPLATIKAVGIFSAVNELKSGLISTIKGQGFKLGAGQTLGDLAPNSPMPVQTALDLVDFLGSSAVTAGIFKYSPKIGQKLTTDVLTTYKAPETIRIDPQKVQEIYKGVNGADASKDGQLLASLGLSKKQIRAAINNGVYIDVPASKLVSVVDRPYWAKLKSILGKEARIPSTTEYINGQKTVNTIAGYLPAGEYTPQEARSAVINSPLKDTPEGKAILKASLEADRLKQNMVISTTEELKQAQDKIQLPDSYTSKVEENAFKKLKDNPIAVRDEYIAKYDNEVSTDLAHNLFEGYRGANAADTQRPAAQLKSIVYDHLLKTRKNTGNNAVLVTAGGSGAGKTSALSNVVPEDVKSEYPIILDTTLASRNSDQEIQKILDNGYQARIMYVLRDPAKAFLQGVLPRAKEEGRVVSEGYHEIIFEKARQAILKLHDKYKDNPNVDIAFIDNTGAAGTAHEVGIDFVRNFRYNADALRKEIQNGTEAAYKAGDLTKEQYDAITADRKELGKATSGQPQQTSSQAGRELTAEEQDAVDLIRDALLSGDSKAAAELYNAFTQDNLQLPPLDQLQTEVDDFARKEMESIEKELYDMKREEVANNPDDPTNQLIQIADRLKQHFNAPGAKFKITGKERVYTAESTGESVRVGGDAQTALDRLVYATDIEGFKKFIRVFHAKFDKVFTEIDNKIKAGAIDDGDYEQFKQQFQETKSYQRAGSRNATKSQSGQEQSKASEASNPNVSTSRTENPIASEEQAKSNPVVDTASENVNPKNVDNDLSLKINRAFYDIEQAQKLKSESDNNLDKAYYDKYIQEVQDWIDKKLAGKDVPAYQGAAAGASIGDYANLRNLSERDGYFQTVEFPEVVQMVKELTGKYPEIWKKLGNKMADAQSGTLRVRMRADGFKDSLTAAKTLAHELGHIADYLPEGMQRKGNLLARIASLNGYLKTLLKEFPESEDNILTPADRERLQKLARENVKQPVTVEEKVQVGFKNVEPQEILAIWNDNTASLNNPELLSYIQGLTDKQKKQIALEAMKGRVADFVDFQHKQYKTITRQVFKNAPEDIRNAYKKLLEEEITLRRLHDLRAIRTELKALSQKWRPFNPQLSDPNYVKYRNSSSELYADAISVLFNDPERLKLEAPKFWKAFFNYIDVKKDVADTFFNTWELLNKGKEEVVSERRKIILEGFATGEQKWQALRAEEKNKKENFFFKFKYDFVDKNQKLIDMIKQARKEGKVVPDDINPEYLLNGRNYLAGRIKYMLSEKIDPIYQTLEKNNITMDQLDEYLLYQRIIHAPERAEIANPYGLDRKTAQDTQDALQKELGNERFNTLEQAATDFRNVMKSYMKEAYELGMYSDELYTQMKDNPAYATFAVLDYLDTYISAHVYQGVGTLKEVASPSTATVMKMVSTIRGIEHQRAKLGGLKFLQQFFPDAIKPAEKQFNGKQHIPIESKDENWKLVKYLDKGKVEGFYTDPYIATSFNYETPDRTNIALSTLRFMNGASFRPLFITFNVGFQTFNFMRDWSRFVKNVPSKSLIKSFYISGKGYAKALKPAYARAFNKSNALIAEMEDKKILSITYNDFLEGKTSEDKQITALMKSYDAMTHKEQQNYIKKVFLAPLEFIERTGNMIETLPKVAGYQMLKGKMSDEELANFVRSYLGSPDFLKGGKAKYWSNELLLFSNAITQGIRSDLSIATMPKTRAGFWYKTAMMNFAPKVLLFMAITGFLGEELKDQMSDISEYDKTNYLVIPFGKQGDKTMYIRIPQDETGRFLGGLFYKALKTVTGEEKLALDSNLFSLFAYGAGQFPSISPAIDVGGGILSYLQGQNPYDSFRGRNVIPEKQFNAGGMERFKPFATWVFQQLGGSIILGASVTEQTDGKKSFLDTLTTAPVLSNIVGRWIKVSNYGKVEQNKQLQTDITRENAQLRIAKDKALQIALDEYKQSDRTEETRKEISKKMVQGFYGSLDTKEKVSDAKALIKEFKIAVIRGKNDPNVNGIIDAPTIKQKMMILQRAKSEMTHDDYAKFKYGLIQNDILSKEAQKQAKQLGL